MSFWLTIYLIFIAILFGFVCFVCCKIVIQAREIEKKERENKFEKRFKEVRKKSLNENIKEFFALFPEDD